MKKFALVSIVLLLICTVGFAQCIEKGYISVNTSASLEVSPDTAEIVFAIKTSDEKSLNKATTENRTISDKVIENLRTNINTENGDYIKTADYTAAPIYSYKDSKSILQRYEVSNSVIVHTKSIDKLGEMIDKAISDGATNVNNLSFSLSNYDAQCNMLIAEASQKAKVRADVVAKSMKTTITGIRTLDTNCSISSNSSPRFYMAKNMLSALADSAATPSTSISGGSVKINAGVDTTFFVK